MLPKNYKYGDGSATDNRVKQIIPILIKWARDSWDEPHYYADVAKIIGSNSQSVGGWLGLIWSHVIHPLFPHAPALNALVCNKDSHLPGDGLDYVFPDYSKKSVEEQKKLVEKENLSAHQYDWNPVLRKLGLKPLDVIPSQALTQYNVRLTKKIKRAAKVIFIRLLKNIFSKILIKLELLVLYGRQSNKQCLAKIELIFFYGLTTPLMQLKLNLKYQTMMT